MDLGLYRRELGLMTWRSGYRHKKATSDCKCNHPQICHYTREGNCVFQACDCKEFKPKGRPEYATAKRGQCQLGHSHDSGLEIKTCADFHILKQAREIKDFSFHNVIDLLGPSGNKISTYEIDFVVENTDGSIEYVECKGNHLARDMGWRLKWALLQDKHRGDPKYKFRVIRG